MFERAKAIPIVSRIMKASEQLVTCAKEEGFLHSNYYANVECGLLALSVMWSKFYSKNDKLGRAIINEAVSGTWRRFFDKDDKKAYRESIEQLNNSYMQIIKNTLLQDRKTDTKSVDTALSEISKIFANHIYADISVESIEFFTIFLYDVQMYTRAYIK